MRVLIISAALLVSAPAVAQQGQQPVDSASQPQAAQPVQAQKPQEKKICKRIDAVESRLGGQKLCLTKAQWKKYESSM